MDTLISPKRPSFRSGHSSRTSLFPLGIILSFSKPHSKKMRPHVTFDHITFVPWKAALRWYRIKGTGISFVLASESVQLYCSGNQVLLCPSRNLSQPLPCWKALWLLCQQWKRKPRRYNDVHYLAMYVLSNMLRDATWSAILYCTKNEEQKAGSSSRGDTEFFTNCKRVQCSLD